MTKLHHTEYKKNYKNYILSTIQEDAEGNPIKTDEEKVKRGVENGETWLKDLKGTKTNLPISKPLRLPK